MFSSEASIEVSVEPSVIKVDGSIERESLELHQHRHMPHQDPDTLGPYYKGHVMQPELVWRDWVAREWIFARRILHFGRDCMFWECRRTRTAEWCVEDLNVRGERVHGLVARSSQLMVPWFIFVELFSRVKWTSVQDKLAALSSLVKVIEEHTGRKYPTSTGKWEHNLIQSLVWRWKHWDRPPPLDVKPIGVPSWLWASCESTVDYTWLTLSSNLGVKARLAAGKSSIFVSISIECLLKRDLKVPLATLARSPSSDYRAIMNLSS
ncbi:uncharacterized protein BCR38DRAFT_475877 [Pseudomassariella vexata]|uniref:Heterokaryon incompatibility domain-containing protein n=1 Tax=Pseudomassariella vexata TaxID=1141098 RepID=A0A1Y2DTE8_9PEZI|nr:uncharacterized protein BCR38DRAFT_475877 [Pseudomassariella vexata]ORY62551.1 hypothetical protein BCR38DRAFT_475877 [Pseudomassariella vexata]